VKQQALKVAVTLRRDVLSSEAVEEALPLLSNHQSDLSCARLLDTTGDGTNAWRARSNMEKSSFNEEERDAARALWSPSGH
jgi:hypothetical protein